MEMIMFYIIYLNYILDQLTNIIRDGKPDKEFIYPEYDYSRYNRTEHYSTQTKMPVTITDRLGDKVFWTWELQEYYLAKEDLPYLALRSYYYFIAFGIVGLIVMLIVVYNFATLKPVKGKKKGRGIQQQPKSIEGLQIKLESLLDKKEGVGAAIAARRRKPKDEEDDIPEYAMQRDLYGSRSYGQRPPGADKSYSISPREQRDLYDHFGHSEGSRNIFDEDYPAPPSPEERLRDRRRR